MRVLGRIAAVLVSLVLIAGVLFYCYPLWFVDRPIYYHLWRADVQSRYVEVGGNRIHYFEAQPSNGQPGVPLVLVHGLGSRGEDWSGLIPAFAANGFHVYVPDLLGYGRSSKPDVDYSIPLQEKTVVGFMEAMHLERADVIGWSMGGWVTMQLALDHPAMVDRLAIYDSAGTYFQTNIPPGLFTPSDTAGVRRLFNTLEPTPKSMPEFAARASLRKLQQNAWIINRSYNSMTSGRNLLDFRLRGLQQPMLILWGGADHLIPPSVGAEIHRAVPHSVFEVVEGCGHLGPAECSKPYLEGTIEFLKAQPAMAGGEKIFPKP